MMRHTDALNEWEFYLYTPNFAVMSCVARAVQ
jgi:hypothetical protein